jgi:hypothetical protein
MDTERKDKILSLVKQMRDLPIGQHFVDGHLVFVKMDIGVRLYKIDDGYWWESTTKAALYATE